MRALATPAEITEGIDNYLEKRIREELWAAGQRAKVNGNKVGHIGLVIAARAPMDTDRERQKALAWLETAARIHNFSTVPGSGENTITCRELTSLAQREWDLV